MCFIYAYIIFQKLIKNHFLIIFETVWRKMSCKICQGFTYEYKINQSKAKVCTHF